MRSIVAHRREVVVITISILVFIVVLLFSSQLIFFWTTFSIDREKTRVEAALKQELDYVTKQREEIISLHILDEAFKNNDLSQLSALSQVEAKKRNLDSVSLTDKYGFIIYRTSLPGQMGDNIFQTTIHGREVAKGKTVNAIINGARIPLAIISASLVYEQNNPIGSVIVGRTVNNLYAERFQREYLSRGEQVVFYTSQEGIVGDSLNDKDKTRLINTYFSLGSDVGAQNLSGLSKEIKMGNDYYIVYHIAFSGIEESPGGAFVLFPIRHGLLSLFLAGSITLLLLLLLLSSLYKFLDNHKHRMQFFLLLGIVMFFVVYFVTLVKLNRSAIELKKSPYLIYNSVIKFEPESDVISQSSEKTVAIKVFTGGEDINAVSVVVNYDSKVVEVLDILTTKSFCDPSFFLEKEISKEKGEVRITCWVPNPGFSDSIGIVAELLVLPLDLKPISLKFAKETQVLANDGLGTDVLRFAVDGYYEVVRQKFADADIQRPIPIFSPSHPNSNRWYKNKNVRLSWPKLLDGTYYYDLSHNPNLSAEDNILSTASNFLDIPIDDGIHYFHLYAKDARGKLGPISNFKIMIDSTSPLSPKIRSSSEMVKKGDIVRFDFTSEDELSGLQSGFYIKINDSIFLPVNPPFYIPFLDSGDYPVFVRVFDRANNFSESSVIIHVDD